MNTVADGSADLVLRGGAIITLADWAPGSALADSADLPTAMAISEGHVLVVGLDDEVGRHIGADTQVVELDGRTVIPGVSDGHLHFTALALAHYSHVPIGPATISSVEDLHTAFSAASVGEDGWLRLQGWSDMALGRPGTRHDLDAALAKHGLVDTPTVAFVWGGHSLIANTAAIRAAGVDASTATPVGGVIEREPDGSPSGLFIDGAMALINAVVPPVASETLRECYLKGQQELHALGLTALTEPGLGPGAVALLDGAGTWDAIEVLGDLAEEGALTLRVNVLALFAGTGGASVEAYRAGIDSGAIERFRARGIDNQRIQISGCKVFADGTTDLSALVVVGETEADRSRELRDLIRLLHDNGLQAGVHTLGDPGTDIVAEAIAAAQRSGGDKGLHHYLIHGHRVLDSTIDLMAEHQIGWTPSPNMIRTVHDLTGWADGDVVDGSAEERYHTVLAAGGYAALGTDAPIVTADWRPAIVHLVKRTQYSRSGTLADPQCVSGLDALAMSTLTVARQQHSEHLRGSLVSGKLADFVVLGGAWPADERIEELLELPTDLTYVAGVPVYNRNQPVSVSA